MDEVFKVGIHFGDEFGHIEYCPAEKKVAVILDNAEKREAVEKYLLTEQIINTAQHSLLDFKEMANNPVADLNIFKLALTRLWNKTGVLVDWSRPVD